MKTDPYCQRQNIGQWF